MLLVGVCFYVYMLLLLTGVRGGTELQAVPAGAQQPGPGGRPSGQCPTETQPDRREEIRSS